MAGHLPFMRGPVVGLADVQAGQVVAFGVGLGAGCDDTSFGPLGLRETSSYFGSHFASNMKAAMDVDRRRVLNAAMVSGRLVDLGDIDLSGSDGTPEDCICELCAGVAERGAMPVLLGGSARLSSAMRRGLADGLGRVVLPIGLRDPITEPVSDGAKLLAVLDLAEVASVWHGGSMRAGFEGSSLSQMRAHLTRIGQNDVVGAAIVGLDPARQGLSTVKTGQRLLVTALLDLIYARLGALEPSEAADG